MGYFPEIDVKDRVGRLLGAVANLPAALTGGGNLKAALVEVTASIVATGAAGATLALDMSVTAVTTMVQAVRDRLPAALVGGRLDVNIGASPATVPVSAAALPLPSGAATEAGNLATIAAKDFATQTTLALVKAKTDNLDVATSTRAVESGGNLATIAAKDFATQTTLALVATESTLSALNTKIPMAPATEGNQTTAIASLVNINTKQPALGTAGAPSVDVISVQGVVGGAAIPTSVAALPLPTGAATETTLALVEAKTPALGAAVTAAASPVVVASDQVVPVQGPDADGDEPTGSPVLVAGVDSDGRVARLPLMSRSALDEPRDTAVPVRSSRLEQAFDTLVGQNAIMIQLLNQIAAFSDPTSPAVLVQLNPPPPIIGDGTGAQLVDVP